MAIGEYHATASRGFALSVSSMYHTRVEKEDANRAINKNKAT